MTIYAIPNCNTVKKALDFLKSKNIDYQFHDYKKKGINPEKVQEWCEQLGWEKVLNKNGLTWKKQPEKVKSAIDNEQKAIAFMVENTSAIKRPIIEFEGKFIVGFDETIYQQSF